MVTTFQRRRSCHEYTHCGNRMVWLAASGYHRGWKLRRTGDAPGAPSAWCGSAHDEDEDGDGAGEAADPQQCPHPWATPVPRPLVGGGHHGGRETGVAVQPADRGRLRLGGLPERPCRIGMRRTSLTHNDSFIGRARLYDALRRGREAHTGTVPRLRECMWERDAAFSCSEERGRLRDGAPCGRQPPVALGLQPHQAVRVRHAVERDRAGLAPVEGES